MNKTIICPMLLVYSVDIIESGLNSIDKMNALVWAFGNLSGFARSEDTRCFHIRH